MEYRINMPGSRQGQPTGYHIKFLHDLSDPTNLEAKLFLHDNPTGKQSF